MYYISSLICVENTCRWNCCAEVISIHRIFYVANNYYDLIFYMAQIFNNMGKTVAVEDVSHNSMLVKLIPDMEYEREWTYKGVDYFRGTVSGEYDIVLSNCDISQCEISQCVVSNGEDACAADGTVIFNSTLRRCDATALRGRVDKNRELRVVLRDVVSSGMGASYLSQHIAGAGDGNWEKQHNIKCYEVYTDIIDYRYRIDMEYEGYSGFSNLSWDYGKVITALITDVMKWDKKKVWHAFKNAREGKIVENSSMG